MTAIVNAAGGDYQGLPTGPVLHRGGRKAEGLPWDQINADYVARGGQVDADVWPKVGKVRLIGNRGGSRKDLHTWEEADQDIDYDNTLSQGTPNVSVQTSRALLTDADQRKVALRYRHGENIQELADAFDVSISAIRTALNKQGEPIRSRNEAQRLRYARQS
jgi:hypothetical protein